MDETMDEQNESTAKDSEQTRMSQINLALGVFVCFFGSVVLFSIFFTETLAGKITNLIAGLVLMTIGIITIFRSKKAAHTS
jgi:predicted RND superfamily exporter protein